MNLLKLNSMIFTDTAFWEMKCSFILVHKSKLVKYYEIYELTKRWEVKAYSGPSGYKSHCLSISLASTAHFLIYSYIELVQVSGPAGIVCGGRV